ncbi:TonB-dependent haemoglobin/transferrin/lactoferrin receptor [Parvularcula bermudensis HTCC2503]|uniref:TonB-dependent haemoglobin/transferrin/lactoferrin receptor n=1 Tax=Parvularcula bermudensis (strain ATCC BAA-594 / HTCC2503 / KCTC 12087) TaxID=314260 RepID=E0THI0_PARBH|nr:TonB-dependent receptor [Parvularcula bermudensis]ADM10772.1 TonB-dependent haemoglobin/transferrin/lactoferrin receptor [Parvularcula bermudensis HTCC2503]
MMKAALIVSVSGLAFAATAFAQNEEDAPEDDVITVYGTSNPIPAIDYPGQVSVIDRSEIDARLVSTVSDALRDVPGLQFSGGPRRTGEVPTLRGLSGQNVLVLLDGARQSFLSAHDGRFFLDPDLIARAEVVRGPASALYGTGAVGGVLAFETVDADDLLTADETFGARFRAGYQSVNEEGAGTVTLFGRQGRLDGLASLTLRQSGDITLGSGADLPSDDDILTGLLKGSFTATDALTLEASWQRFDNTAIEPNNGQGTSGLDDGAINVEKEIVTDTFRIAAAFNPSSDLIDARLTAYWTETTVDEFDDSVPQLLTRDVETTGISLRNASRFTLGGLDLTATIGGDWFEDKQIGTDDQTEDFTRGGVPNGSAEFVGVFGQLEAILDRPLGLPGELIVIPGVRFDSFKNSSEAAGTDNEDEAVSPRIAASYGPSDWFRVFGSYSEGFRAPSLNELYLDGVHFPLPHPILFDPAGMPPNFTFVNNNFIPNPDLEPEKTATTEVGIALDFASVITQGDRFQAKLSRFESDVENLINLSVDVAFDPTCFAPPFFPCTAGTTESANVADAGLTGTELEARYDSDLFYGYLSYSSIDGEDEATGADLGTLTPGRLALDLGYRTQGIGATFGTRLQVADEFTRRDLVDGELEIAEERDGYTVLDLYATWVPPFADSFRVDLGVDNVTEEDFERVFEDVSEPGRNYKASIAYRIAY